MLKIPPSLKKFLEPARSVVTAIAIALVVNNTIIANAVVPTSSMEKTIMPGTRVFGSRIDYYLHAPEFGDVAIFRFGTICSSCKAHVEHGFTECPSCGKPLSGGTLYYIKRVIGCPGDHIEIRQGDHIGSGMFSADVYRNGEKLEEAYLPETMLYTGEMDFIVPDGQFFLMGDNRNYSHDARFWNDHFIDEDEVIAKAYFKYFPSIGLIR